MRSSFCWLLIFSAIGFSACDNLDIMKKKSSQSTSTSTSYGDSLTGNRGNISTPTDPNTNTTTTTTTTTGTTSTDPGITSNRSIVGTWRFVNIEADGLTEEQKQQTISLTEIEFTPDGRVLTTALGETAEPGTYHFDTQYGILRTTEADGRQETSTVEWLGDRIRMTFEGGRAIMERVR